MALAAAAIGIDRRVRLTRRIRYRCLQGALPALVPVAPEALADWVATELAAGRLTLLEAGFLDIDGQWGRFRFPCSHP